MGATVNRIVVYLTLICSTILIVDLNFTHFQNKNREKIKNQSYENDTIIMYWTGYQYIGRRLFPDLSDKSYLDKVGKSGVLRILECENKNYVYILCKKELLTDYLEDKAQELMKNKEKWLKMGYQFEKLIFEPNDLYSIKGNCGSILISQIDENYYIDGVETCENEFIRFFLLSDSCEGFREFLQNHNINIPILPDNGKVKFISSAVALFKDRNKLIKKLNCSDTLELNENYFYGIEIEIKNCKINNLEIYPEFP
ncbi:MAG: hypothetical protein KatS3mg034_2154 [Vicingaceae bacterium]|nr:MAG: hypothetical protein KatS3mg034_2154 [Vicingaceae bacterium]